MEEIIKSGPFAVCVFTAVLAYAAYKISLKQHRICRLEEEILRLEQELSDRYEDWEHRSGERFSSTQIKKLKELTNGSDGIKPEP